jgi:hypothetical protein
MIRVKYLGYIHDPVKLPYTDKTAVRKPLNECFGGCGAEK